MELLIILSTISIVAAYGMIKSIRHEKKVLHLEKLLFKTIIIRRKDLDRSYKVMKEDLVQLRSVNKL